MIRFGDAPGATPLLGDGGRAIRTFLLQATGARPGSCDYCGSTVAVGETRCPGCGAAASIFRPATGDAPPGRPWLALVLLGFIFPPALLVMLPMLFWRWLRKADRGWLLPILLCLMFPPAVLLVAPALLFRPAARGRAT